MFADIRTYEEFRATSLSDRVKLIEIGRTMVSPEVAAQAGVLAAKHASGAKVRPVFVPVCVQRRSLQPQLLLRRPRLLDGQAL